MHNKLLITSFLILVTSVSFSQITKKKDTLKTEEITVEKQDFPLLPPDYDNVFKENFGVVTHDVD